MKQIEQIYQYLDEKGSITSLDAFRLDPPVTRLAAVIHTLRHKKGVPITTVDEHTASGKVYARYVLER